MRDGNFAFSSYTGERAGKILENPINSILCRGEQPASQKDENTVAFRKASKVEFC